MSNKILMTIGIIALLAVAGVVVWTFMAPSEVAAPVSDEESEDVFVREEGEDTSGSQLTQFAPDENGLPEAESQEDEVIPGEAQHEEEEVSEVTVSMTEAGFSPDIITVPLNTTVTFINNGQAPRWPASDPHPTHSALPGFDSERGLNTGETFSYTFDQAGEWSYHDHLETHLTGTIVVE